MGSRASQLRSRQQVQDLSTTGITFSSDANGDDLVNNGSANIKALKYEQNNNNNSNNNININISSNNDGADNADMSQDAMAHQKAVSAAAAGADSQDKNDVGQLANGNATNGTPILKGFSLQDRASNFAQRIRRSSSIKKLFPTFVAGRRKVS